jgi:ribonuclease HII
VSELLETPLAALRARADAARSARALRRLAALLARDPRAGARALAEACRRRAAELEREARRFAGLFALRDRLARAGARAVAGVDEVGVGPLAGPVVAAAVVLPARPSLPGLDDSKRLARPARERLAAAIGAQAEALAIAEVWVEEIDRRNVYQAGLLAMRRAVETLERRPDHVLVDARTIPALGVPQTPLVGGDGLDGSIAAASVVAKVHRDAIMARLDAEYPGYGFRRHMGYATREHLRALDRLGASPVHRRSFAPVAQLPLFARA